MSTQCNAECNAECKPAKSRRRGHVTQLMTYCDADEEFQIRFGIPQNVLAVPESLVLERYGNISRQALWRRRSAARLPRHQRGGRVKSPFTKEEIELLDQVHVAIASKTLTLAMFQQKINQELIDIEGNRSFYTFSEFVREYTNGLCETWREFAIYYSDNFHAIFPSFDISRDPIATLDIRRKSNADIYDERIDSDLWRHPG